MNEVMLDRGLVERIKTNIRSVSLALGITVLGPALLTADTETPQAPPLQQIEGFGVNIAGYDWYGNMNPGNIVENLEQVGAEHAVFNPALYVKDDQIIDGHHKTPQLDDVSELASLLDQHGIPLAVKPLLEVDGVSGFSWRGEFVPEDADRWFKSYAAAVVSQYSVAYEHGSRTLVIGTELSALEGDEYAKYWEEFIEDIRGRFPGTSVGYDQNWDRIGSDPAFVRELDSLSYSMYKPMDPNEPIIDQWMDQAQEINELARKTRIERKVGEHGIAFTGLLGAPNQEDKLEPFEVEPNPELVEEYIGSACLAFRTYGLTNTIWAIYTSPHIVNGENRDLTRGFGAVSDDNLAPRVRELCGTTS